MINNLDITPVTHQIAERLRAAILADEIKPGEWLRQEQLAQKFGVSQTPVREALKNLVAEGLLEHVPYRGIRVMKPSLVDFIDLYAIRACLESLAARSAAQNITAGQLAELKSLSDQIEQHRTQNELFKYRQFNRQFHQCIYTASGHPYLIRMLDQLWNAFPTMLLGNFPATAVKRVPGQEESDKQEHQAIIAALESHNSERAAELMCAHVEERARNILAVLTAEQNLDQPNPNLSQGGV